MKSILALCVVAASLLVSVNADFDDIWHAPDNKDDDISHEDHKHGYGLRVFPGLKVRLAQGAVDMFKENLLAYGRSYINYDLDFTKMAHDFHFHTFPLSIHAAYWNVTHDPIQFDLSRFRLDFTKMKSDYQDVVFFELPLIKYFAFGFDYEYDLPHLPTTGKGHFNFTMNDTLFIVTLKLGATDKGHLYPQIHDLRVNYTNTDMTSDGFFLKKIMYHEFFKIAKYTSMSALNHFGARIFNKNLPEYVRRLTNSQHYKFTLDYPQLGKKGDFNIDYALTKPPKIHNRVMDLDFFFDVGAGNSQCTIAGDEHDYLF